MTLEPVVERGMNPSSGARRKRGPTQRGLIDVLRKETQKKKGVLSRRIIRKEPVIYIYTSSVEVKKPMGKRRNIKKRNRG